MNKVLPPRLSRYTSISALIDMLLNKRLFLSDPDYWKDKTDAHFLKQYAKGKEVRALCFFKDNETNLYWELYAKGGCMIEFDTKKLLGKIPAKSGFKKGDVEYIKRNDFDPKKHSKKLPFIKQLRFEGESEYRIVWKGEKKEISIPIDFNSINKIFISGDVKKEIADSLKILIQEIIGKNSPKKIPINHSKLYENPHWKKKLTATKGAKK
ncbi:MAG: hypothetical protein FWF67_04755 [Fibromonadales bacterium]|nr:hypothetical protein [Fibromonadales bacterium]